MTEKQSKEFKLGCEVGYYGDRAKVVSHWTSKVDDVADATHGIVISVPQRESEIKGKTRNKEYVITDKNMVLKLEEGK